mgnify:FL=1
MANSAIEACYTYGDEWVDEQNAYLTENAEFVISYLKEHAPQIKPVKPEGTYLMWLDCSGLSMTSEEMVKILASEYKMAVGGAQDIRAMENISFALILAAKGNS